MNVLAFDTSGPGLSLALHARGDFLRVDRGPAGSRHAESLTPEIHKLLRRARLRPAELDLVAVGIGPGSFTGLRVGVTTAKALALALGIRLVGVCGFEAIARSTDPEQGPVCVVSDARRERWHAALYESVRGTVRLRKGPAVIAKERLTTWAGKRARIAGEPAGQTPEAEWIARIAIERARRGRTDDPRRLVPLYLHPKDCNVTRPRAAD